MTQFLLEKNSTLLIAETQACHKYMNSKSPCFPKTIIKTVNTLQNIYFYFFCSNI